MTETRDDTRDDDVRVAVLAAGLATDSTFTAELRARLAAIAGGDIELEPRRPDRTRPWIPLVAAAVVIALVAAAIALIARERGPDVVPTDDLLAGLVGSTWVAVDVSGGGDLPTLAMKVGATRPDVIMFRGNDGCNQHTGEFRLDGSTVVDAEIAATLIGCVPSTAPVMPREGAALSISGDVLTVSADGVSTSYTAIESLPVVSGAALDGLWEHQAERFAITDGQVSSTALPDGIAIDLASALAAGTVEAWAYGDSLVVRTPSTGYRRLDHIAGPPGATLLDQLVGRTWVGVDGPWRTTSPTLVFDSLNVEPGSSALSVDDGCNSGGGTFELDGDQIVASEIAIEDGGCAHEIAHLTDGTTLTVTDGVLTVTGGPTTVFVALDSLDASAPDLDGTWLVGGATFSIDGEQVTSADASPDNEAAVEPIDVLTSAVSGVVEGWRYGDGWIIHGAGHYVQLQSTGPPEAGDDPVVTTGPRESAEEALITGTLAMIDGCLVKATNETVVALVWQPGTTWDARSAEVVLPDGTRAAVGDFIETGGGYHAVADLGGFFGVSDDGVATITACADTVGPEIAVIQSPVSVTPAPADDPTVDDEEEAIRTYLDHAAAGRYVAAGTLLQSGAIENVRRSDLRPLLRDELGLDDLASALEVWCSAGAICAEPTDLEAAGTGVYAATFVDGDRTVTGYFRGGTYEGTPEVRGLPPRRPPAGDVVACPTSQVDGWVEADLDGDGAPETVVRRALQAGQYELVACNTALEIPPYPVESANGTLIVLTLDPDASGRDVLLIGGTTGSWVALHMVALADDATGLADFDTGANVGTDAAGTGYSFGCEVTAADSYLGSGQHLVWYEYRYVGGTGIDDSSAMDVVIRVPGGGPVLDEYRLELAGATDAAQRIIEPTCAGLPVLLD